MTWPDPPEGLSIVIPTFNERDNIDDLLRELRLVQSRLERPLEVVLVDDNSPDGTAVLAERLGKRLTMDLRVLTRNGRRSLGGAIADGLRMCRWDLVCVMDADLSHPVPLVPSLVDSLDGVDGVVASRYVLGGGIESWPLNRRVVSLVATAMARIFLGVPYRDPLSGFFLVRRSLLHGIEITGDGNKPLLEILVALRPIMKEVPYRFRNRRNGESKLDGQSILDFVRLVVRLRRTAGAEARPVPEPCGADPDREP
jgi:dolichol-phosphate mannosyltransferase